MGAPPPLDGEVAAPLPPPLDGEVAAPLDRDVVTWGYCVMQQLLSSS
jgi:hypothetical protein